MKFATLADGTRDGQLLLVDRAGQRAIHAAPIAATMQDALERWDDVEAALLDRSAALNAGQADDAFDVDIAALGPVLPRSYQFIDGSAYLNHIELVRKARGAEMPESFQTDPLVYQGVSDGYLGPREDIVVKDLAWGVDFEGEVAVITGDVPYHCSKEEALGHVRLLCILNDVSLRMLIPSELGKGFGFLVSKPPSALSPFAITPDELGDSWRDGRIWLPLEVEWNGEWFGNPDAGPEMQFGFDRLIEHVAQTRPLRPGTVIGSGTVSNKDRSRGSCCIAEKRMIEKIETGAFITPFMQFGDTVKIDMLKDGRSVFGSIEQKLVPWEA